MILFPGDSWYRNWGPKVESSLPFSSRIDWKALSVQLPFDPKGLASSSAAVPVFQVTSRTGRLNWCPPCCRCHPKRSMRSSAAERVDSKSISKGFKRSFKRSFNSIPRLLLSSAAPLLRYDLRGAQPDAFTALMDELARRPLRVPEVMDPRSYGPA